MGLFNSKKKKEREAEIQRKEAIKRERQGDAYFNGKINPKYHPHYKENVIEYYASLKYPEDKYAYLNDSRTTSQDRQILREAGFDFDEVPRAPFTAEWSEPYYYPEDMPIPYEYMQRWIIDFSEPGNKILLAKKRYLIPDEVIEANEKHKKYPPYNPGMANIIREDDVPEEVFQEALRNNNLKAGMYHCNFKSNKYPGKYVSYSPEFYQNPYVIDPYEGDLGDEHDIK